MQDPETQDAKTQDADPNVPAPPPSAEEAVTRVLTHIERQARRRDDGAAYDGLLAVPALPLEALAALGDLSRLDAPSAHAADALPWLLLTTDTGTIGLELCPFGPLALLSGDGTADTDPVAQALFESGLYPLFPALLDEAGNWHDHPLARWLFPRRLSDATALFETLRR